MELKAMTVLNIQQMGCYDNALVYFKSEADKVIADKDAEIAQLQAMLEERNKQVGELKAERDWLAKDRAQAYDDLEKRAQLNIKQEESIRHHKYKRCLDNAWWCRKLSNAYAWNASNLRGLKIAVYDDKKAELYRRWHKRWLQIAEKIKEGV